VSHLVALSLLAGSILLLSKVKFSNVYSWSITLLIRVAADVPISIGGKTSISLKNLERFYTVIFDEVYVRKLDTLLSIIYSCNYIYVCSSNTSLSHIPFSTLRDTLQALKFGVLTQYNPLKVIVALWIISVVVVSFITV